MVENSTVREITETIRRAPVTAALTVGCVCVFFLSEAMGESVYARFALTSEAVLRQGEYLRLLTAAFLHFGVQHLFNNMLILFLAGGVVERNLGGLRFLCLCLATGVCGNLVSVFWDAYTNAQSISVGASGMVFGVMGVILVILLRVRDRLGEGSTLGKRALLMLALSVYSGFTAGNINNAAHLGGLAAGVLLGLLWTHGRTHYDLSGLR